MGLFEMVVGAGIDDNRYVVFCHEVLFGQIDDGNSASHLNDLFGQWVNINESRLNSFYVLFIP